MSICAANIKRILDERGYKQCVIAKKSGFTENQFSAMVNGRKKIYAEYIPAIASALDVCANDLFVPDDDSIAKEKTE